MICDWLGRVCVCVCTKTIYHNSGLGLGVGLSMRHYYRLCVFLCTSSDALFLGLSFFSSIHPSEPPKLTPLVCLTCMCICTKVLSWPARRQAGSHAHLFFTRLSRIKYRSSRRAFVSCVPVVSWNTVHTTKPNQRTTTFFSRILL